MKYNKYFEVTKCKAEIVSLHKDAPVELQNLIHDIHRDLNSDLPENWIYDNILDAFFKIEEEYASDIEIETILNEIEPAIYNYNLIDWSQSYYAQLLIDEAEEEFGYKDFIGVIRNGQYKGLDIIYRNVHEFINQPTI